MISWHQVAKKEVPPLALIPFYTVFVYDAKFASNAQHNEQWIKAFPKPHDIFGKIFFENETICTIRGHPPPHKPIHWQIQGVLLVHAPPKGPDSFVLTYKFYKM